MDDTSDIAAIASLLGDPSRAKMLLALMGGRAMTASELSLEADVSPATTSAHLAKLVSGGLLRIHKQGRYRYFQIADELIAELVEKLIGVAERSTKRTRPTGPKDPAMKHARVCYDHLAGEVGVSLFEGLTTGGWLVLHKNGTTLTSHGARHMQAFGIDVDELSRLRRPLCRQCLDWSERRHHLAGALGAAVLGQILKRRWARRDLNSRAVHFSEAGHAKLAKAFDF